MPSEIFENFLVLVLLTCVIVVRIVFINYSYLISLMFLGCFFGYDFFIGLLRVVV